MNQKLNLTLTALLTLGLAACSPPVKEPERTGFISDYSRLEMEKDETVEITEDEAYSFVSDKLANYRAFMVDDIEHRIVIVCVDLLRNE